VSALPYDDPPAPPTTQSPLAFASEIIAATGLLSAEKLELACASAVGGSLAEGIRRAGLASSEAVARSLARRFRLPLIDLTQTTIDFEATNAVSLHVLKRLEALPYELDGNTLRIVVADPLNVHRIDELRLATSHQLQLAVASRDDILAELQRLGRSAEAFGARIEELIVEEGEEGDDLEADDGISDAPIVRLVNSIVFQAAEDGASDIHFEPQEDSLLVRVRVDGVLRETQRIPKRVAIGATTRLKVLAKLDIAERRLPQDGRISLNAAAAGRMLDVRVATLPTVDGEAVVMRLLDKSRKAPTLEDLGMSQDLRARVADVIRKPTGALLVTGPTGLGKSTTLYAALAELNKPELKAITVEDPVEYRLAGVSQMQINTKAGLTFASALRTILRSDPDVIMVGEIRDVETAKISIEAALTGHFVLSTLHTNDAPSALTRLNEMGVEPFLTASAVSAVLAQRLARRLCGHCRESYNPTPEELAAAGLSTDLQELLLYRKVGCGRCNRTGYKGRIALAQLMVMNEELEGLAARRASHDELERAAIENGMCRLWDDGLARVEQGVTSLEELGRVLS